ncbi:CDP-glycerol glycerophosphotransferase family protein, partial [Staphylococcus warneri]
GGYFRKKEKEVYTKTWEGTALKDMGLDIADCLMKRENRMGNFLICD